MLLNSLGSLLEASLLLVSLFNDHPWKVCYFALTLAVYQSACSPTASQCVVNSFNFLSIYRETKYSFFLGGGLFVFLGLHPWHTEVPTLGAQLDLQLLAYATATLMPDLSCVCELQHSSRQRQILNPLIRARD